MLLYGSLMRFMTLVVRILVPPMYFSSAFLIPCVVVLPRFEDKIHWFSFNLF